MCPFESAILKKHFTKSSFKVFERSLTICKCVAIFINVWEILPWRLAEILWGGNIDTIHDTILQLHDVPEKPGWGIPFFKLLGKNT